MEGNKEKIRIVIDINILMSALIKDSAFTIKLIKSKFLEWSNDPHLKQQKIAVAYTTDEISRILKTASPFND